MPVREMVVLVVLAEVLSVSVVLLLLSLVFLPLLLSQLGLVVIVLTLPWAVVVAVVFLTVAATCRLPSRTSRPRLRAASLLPVPAAVAGPLATPPAIRVSLGPLPSPEAVSAPVHPAGLPFPST